MKKGFKVSFIFVITLSILVLASCASKSTVLENVTVNTKEESVEMLTAFYDKILEKGSVKAIYKSGSEVQYVEYVDGTSSCVETADGTKVYAYVDGEDYYYAYESEDYHYAEVNKEYYDLNYCYHRGELRILDYLTEENGTFSCKKRVTQTESATLETIEFEFVAEQGTFRFFGTAKDGYVNQLSISITMPDDPEGNKRVSLRFIYDDVELVVPNGKAWIHQANNLMAINEKEDFFFSTYYSDNVIVDVTSGEFHMIETIADGVDLVDYQTGTKTYAFADDENCYYCLEYEDSKVYFTDPEYYELACNVYYLSYISLFDKFADEEDITFTTQITYEEESDSGILVFTVYQNDEAEVIITATKVDSLVNRVVVESEGTEVVMTFTYGTATNTRPDLSDWYYAE